MTVAELLPPPNLKVLFNLSSFRRVPVRSGCYVLTTSAEMILYVGLATNLSIRFQQHLDNPGKTKPTKEGRAYLFHYLECEGKNLNQLERSWLNQYAAKHGCRPVLNKADSPVS